MKLGDLTPLTEDEREIIRSLRLASEASAAVARAIQNDRITPEDACEKLELAHEFRTTVIERLDDEHRWKPALRSFLAERTQALRELTRAIRSQH